MRSEDYRRGAVLRRVRTCCRCYGSGEIPVAGFDVVTMTISLVMVPCRCREGVVC